MSIARCLAGIALILPALAIAADPAPKPAKKPAAPKQPQRHQIIDHGPFVTATIPAQWEEHGITNKAVAVKLSHRPPGRFPVIKQRASGEADPQPLPEPVGGILFDTDTCRLAACWTGGFIDFTKDWTSVRDSKSVKIVGTQLFGTRQGPGWARPNWDGPNGWKDVRKQGFGPLPADWVKYKGIQLQYGQPVLSYRVGDADVLESVHLLAADPRHITRQLRIGPSSAPLRVLVADRQAAKATINDGVLCIDKANADSLRAVARGKNVNPRWMIFQDGDVQQAILEFDQSTEVRTVEIHLWSVPPAEADAATTTARAIPQQVDVHLLPLDQLGATRSLQPLWPDVITTAGKLGEPKADAAYTVDTLTLPDKNPWNAWMRPGGFDFFTSDPTKAALCNWSGDVWIVSGINADLKELKWKRFASGLFQPLGLKIVNDQIYVTGRDQITRLVDLNNDGEADFYENFNNDVEVTPNFHEFTFDLHTDREGNFYFAKAGPVRNGGRGFDTIAAHHGSILKVSPDGKTLARYATGFRAPNGIGVSPYGQVTAGDNEGTWTPKCRLTWIRQDGFYGVVPTAHQKTEPKDYDRPLCWFPKNIDNSSGGQAWVTGFKWGPFEDRLLHMSYGTCSLFLVMKEDLPDGTVQGGVVRLPVNFDSGIMRARFNPADGQLYVAGLKGWQTSAGKDGCFQRVRYTGKPVNLPTALKATATGFEITFTSPLNKEDANDVGSFSIERWNYNWTEAYGSPDVSVNDPTKSGHDAVKIKSARLLPDGKTVSLELESVKPAMQYRTQINLTTADGADVRCELIHTVHAFPK